MTESIVAAKVEQAAELLQRQDLPLWIAQFARETYDHPDPVQDLVVGTTVTWPAAFVIAADGSTIAVVGTGDVANVRDVGAYREVIGYVRDVGPPLREVLERFDPQSIGVSYSVDDDHADGLTHGMFQMLSEYLRGTPFADRLTSADATLVALRGRKLPDEIRRIRGAIRSTLEIFDFIEGLLRPGITERQVVETVHRRVRELGFTMAWDYRYDPVVNFGPESKFGHAGPGDISLEPGMLVHVDLGLKRDGYCSDLQRMWYLLRREESEAPAEILSGFNAVVSSLRAGFDALRPGVEGWVVDAAARRVLSDAGLEEPQFALGHQLGQTTHDGGALLGPQWPRYGNRPCMEVEQGNVFTLEFGLRTSAGMIGLEEDVLVTEDGAEYLAEPQISLRYVGP